MINELDSRELGSRYVSSACVPNEHDCLHGSCHRAHQQTQQGLIIIPLIPLRRHKSIQAGGLLHCASDAFGPADIFRLSCLVPWTRLKSACNLYRILKSSMRRLMVLVEHGTDKRQYRSQQSIQKCVGYALKYYPRCGEDLWSCIIDECRDVSPSPLLIQAPDF